MRTLESDKKPGKVVPNIATMLKQNATRFPGNIVFSERRQSGYEGITWEGFFTDVKNIAYNLRRLGFKKGDKMVVFSPNRLEMLELEMAVMASGGISVPLFAYFKKETVELLARFSDASYLAVAGQLQLDRINPGLPLKQIFAFDDITTSLFEGFHSFKELLNPSTEDVLEYDAGPDEIVLNMFTSGTMGTPKCVQLTHRNILSQQAALKQIWNVSENDRFLSYLPWHHSFGGIFERFSSLYNGATMYLDSGQGKDPRTILNNWQVTKPTVFFSVPKTYQMLMELLTADKDAEQTFFHPELRFIFTAAAPLPKRISDEFESRNIPVYEGWGLTETSPCCTLTDPNLKRIPGIVGKPIPGVSIRLSEDNEIQVKGDNVMKGYYNNDTINKEVFTEDGWFCTGDVGEITPTGIKLVSRKDRIFKLTNGEKVIPTDLETLIQNKCHYVMFAMVVGSGQEYPVALLFPNKKILDNPDYRVSPEEGCFCPRDIHELGKCLHGCLHDANCGIGQKFSKIKYALLVDDELSIEGGTLTPSMKPAPKNVAKAFRAQLDRVYNDIGNLPEDVIVIKLDATNNVAREIKA